MNQHVFPLSLSQHNIWDLERSFFGTSINSISTTIRIRGRVDFSILQKTLNLVLEADSSLRTRILLQDGVPMQTQSPFVPEQFPVFDFSLTDQAGIAHWETTLTRESLPLYDAPLYRFVLFRISEEEGGVLVKTHHIISDGWSQVQLCNRIGQTYLDLLGGQEVALPPSPSYEGHVDEETAYLTSKAYGRDKSYWQTVLETAGEPSAIKHLKSAAVSPVGRRKSFELPQVLNHAIYTFCMEHRVAPFAVFYMALAIYLKRIGGSDRFTIGVPIFNRTNFTFKQTTGMFVSTLPFFNQVCDEWNLLEFNDALANAWFDLLRHQRFPFPHIVELAEAMRQADGRLFHIALSYQDSKLMESPDASVLFSGRWHYSGYQSEQLCIHLTNLEDNRKYAVDYDYLAQVFSDQEIEDLHAYLTNILLAALTAPETPLYALPILGTREREQVLYTFNRTARPLLETSLYDAFCRAAAAHSRRAALIYQGQRTTYGELKTQGQRVAAALQAADFPVDEAKSRPLAVLLLHRTPALFAAQVGCMQMGYAWLTLSPDLPKGRIQQILAQSGAQCVLTTPEIRSRFGDLDTPVLDMDRLPDPTNLTAQTQPGDLAYVVYTSGSTGMPKGVSISQRNLLNFSRAMAPLYGRGAVLSLCNIGFDAFILESTVSLLNARTIVLPLDQEQEDPAKLAALITGFGVGFLAVTPSRLAVFLQQPAFLKALRSIESLVCGGEAFPGELLQKLKLYTNARIYNQYGPSETTIGVSYKLLNNADVISVGRPMDNCRLYVLDERLQPLPIGVYGHLYVGGLCVGLGYRNAPELTEAVFLESPFEPGERLYQTGDIACWTPEGELLLAGRADKQVKLRGLRIEPQEVAACIASHPRVKEAAAKVHDNMLLAYYTADAPLSEAELLSFAGAFLPRYMIPAAVLRIDAIPLTKNGKIDESRLPLPQAEEPSADPATPMQALVLSVFRRTLQKPELCLASDYFLSGGNSLNAMEAIGEIEESTGVRLRISDLYACRTAKRLSEVLSGGEAPAAPVRFIEPAPPCDGYPLSPMQEGIYVQSRLDPTGLAYNMPGAFRLGFVPDPDRLQQAFERLIRQDDSFRTAFVQEGAGVRAKVLDPVPFVLPVLSAPTLEEAFSLFLKPFDLAKPPLLRAALWQDILLIDSHHIVGDGVSTPILLERLAQAYDGPLPSLPLTYKDFAYDLANRPAAHSESLAYWRETLSPLPEALDLPTDFIRPSVFDFQGGRYSIALTAETSQAAEAYCRDHGLTPYMLFLGAFGLLLSRLSGQKDLLVGTPVSCRTHPELQTVVGPFITTLPLRLQPQGSVEAYFQQVKSRVLGMLDHQDAPLEEILGLFELPRSLSHNPLYQVLFSLRPLEASGFLLGGAPLTFLPMPGRTTKLDLSLEAAKEEGRYSFHFEYAASLFRPETIALFARSYKALLESVLSGQESRTECLNAWSAADRLRLWDKPNRTVAPYVDLPVHTLIEETALLYPEETAVLWHGEKTTFRELAARARVLGGILARHGVQKGDKIGLCCRRDPDLFACMLAILQSGCAYVPFLASYPEERIAFMLENARISLILCDPETAAALPASLPGKRVLTTEESGPFAPILDVRGDDLMYVLYTSGSTGKPKGVELPHRALSNLLDAMRPLMSPHQGPMLCSTNMTFDIFITEGLLALAQGITVVLADEEEMLLPWKLAELIEASGATMAQFTPSRLQLCLHNEAFAKAVAQIEFVILVGEAVTPLLLDTFKAHSRGRFLNMYGPTEAAVYVTVGELQAGEPVHIGKPLRNCRVYVLDEARRPALPTARGELYLAGECLALGYLARPDLTEQVFVDDPFFPGQKMYRTGDMGRLLADGRLECLGRTDTQIKVNGNRVELDEINGALLQNGAGQAATLPRRHPDGSVSLCAFVSPASADLKALTAGLRKRLPAYMIPAPIYAVEALPYNASGKLDLPLLKNWAEAGGPPVTPTDITPQPRPISAPAAEPHAAPLSGASGQGPSGLDADAVLAVWKQILGKENLDADRSFFEQGGTSLGALNVLSQYYNLGHAMTLAQFYEAPTARAQAALLGGNPADTAPTTPQSAYPRQVPEVRRPLAAKPKRVLLTGATGFFGAHLLYALLEQGVKKVLCTMRDGSPERLQKTLVYYFGKKWAKAHAEAVAVVPGDVSLPALGLNKKAYQNLIGRIDAVYHAAADVRHYTTGSVSEAVNLTGTQTILALAKDAGVPLHHISTASIGGEYLTSAPQTAATFTERDLDMGQNWQENIYLKTKFLAEAAVYDAVKEGLDARVYRLGRLVGRYRDGCFQLNPENNAFYTLVQGLEVLGCLPESLAETPTDLVPVDICAQAVLALSRAPQTSFHLIDPHPLPLRQVLPRLAVVSDLAFEEALAQAAAAGKGPQLAPLIELWTRLRLRPIRIKTVCDLTRTALEQAGFCWPPTDPERLLCRFHLPKVGEDNDF